MSSTEGSQLQVTADRLTWLLFALVLVALAILIISGILAGRSRQDSPHFSRFLLHYTVAALVVVGVVLLAVDGAIDKAVVSALLGSLLGYVLGSNAQVLSQPQESAARPEAPTVTGVKPDRGSSQGGEAVSIRGRGFVPGSSVSFGSVTATPVTFHSASELTVTSPPSDPKIVDVIVTTHGGSSTPEEGSRFRFS